jgi:hypothetical protein
MSKYLVALILWFGLLSLPSCEESKYLKIIPPQVQTQLQLTPDEIKPRIDYRLVIYNSMSRPITMEVHIRSKNKVLAKHFFWVSGLSVCDRIGVLFTEDALEDIHAVVVYSQVR